MSKTSFDQVATLWFISFVMFLTSPLIFTGHFKVWFGLFIILMVIFTLMDKQNKKE